MIHEIARKQPCSDGRLPILTGIKADGELYTYDLQCEDTRDGGFDRRDTVEMCTTTCTEVCYHPVRSWCDLQRATYNELHAG